MYQFLELESPLDRDHLKVAVPDVERVQFDEPLTNDDYQLLAQVLEQCPHVTLRVYGYSQELAGLDFLRLFPELRRFSVSNLMLLDDVSRLNVLPDDLEYLDLGETKRPLDLTPLKFSRLSGLRVVGHHRGLSELVARNHELRVLSLWRLRFDQVLPIVALPDLESLVLTLGSLTDSHWLAQFPSLRFLGIRQTRRLADLSPVRDLSKLEWLWLDTLSGVSLLPDFSANAALVRADLDGLRSMQADNALEGLVTAPNLEQLSVSNSRLPVSAFEVLRSHPRLSFISVGLGSAKRNREVEDMLDVVAAPNIFQFARQQGISLIL
ncbi:hypothetical protein [Catellatospora sichuanensis]|uniref:hypothetical protein n=1 Tax=Catellatospora sichuanensis TaxID=1969805 RepID=UPI001183817A|nr:hypothetical protein [Catellatospora sichuanensis]